MFGLSRREQYWAGEQRAAELLTEITCAALKAQAEIQVAEAQADAAELERLREKYNELIFAVGMKYPGETRHETAMRYIKKAEEPAATAQAKTPDNAELSGREAIRS